MNKLSRSEKGFGAAETLVILVVIVLIGLGGWLVYKDHHKTMTATITSSKKVSDKLVGTTLGKAPTALRKAVISNLKSTGCIKSDGQVGDVMGGDDGSPNNLLVSYVQDRGATVNVCDSVNLYAFSGNRWIFIESSQDEFNCSILKRYYIPTSLLSTTNQSVQCDSDNTVPIN
jgi:hypothetical protein